MKKDEMEKKKRHDEDVAEVLTSKDFYDGQKLLNKGADINLIWGQRSNGKTFYYLRHALRTYKKTGRTFVYIRRWAEDIVVKNMIKLFAPLKEEIENIFGPGYTINYYRGAFLLVYEGTSEDSDDEEARPSETIGWAIALNQVAHTKSQTFVGAKIVIYDEFLSLKSERALANERDAFEQTLSTVLRTTQDAEIYLIGNSVTKYSWAFTTYGIDLNKVKQGEVGVIELPDEQGQPTKIAYEWCQYNPKIGTRTSKYVINSKMARTGEFEIAPVANIPHVDNEIAKEKMLCSLFDNVMNINLGIFLRKSHWITLKVEGGIYVPEEHYREFLVIRETPKQSSFYHLTMVKDLSYGHWCDINMMLKDILENTEIDIMRELKMGRVYAEDMFTADYFCNTYNQYLKVRLDEYL